MLHMEVAIYLEYEIINHVSNKRTSGPQAAEEGCEIRRDTMCCEGCRHSSRDESRPIRSGRPKMRSQPLSRCKFIPRKQRIKLQSPKPFLEPLISVVQGTVSRRKRFR